MPVKCYWIKVNADYMLGSRCNITIGKFSDNFEAFIQKSFRLFCADFLGKQDHVP
jgi:hypothetical protein